MQANGRGRVIWINPSSLLTLLPLLTSFLSPSLLPLSFYKLPGLTAYFMKVLRHRVGKPFPALIALNR